MVQRHPNILAFNFPCKFITKGYHGSLLQRIWFSRILSVQILASPSWYLDDVCIKILETDASQLLITSTPHNFMKDGLYKKYTECWYSYAVAKIQCALSRVIWVLQCGHGEGCCGVHTGDPPVDGGSHCVLLKRCRSEDLQPRCRATSIALQVSRWWLRREDNCRRAGLQMGVQQQLLLHNTVLLQFPVGS